MARISLRGLRLKNLALNIMVLANNFKIFIVIPCYNEADHLTEVIQAVKSYGQVVVVDDGSTDNSRRLAKNQGVKVISHLLNRGQGAALETGNRYVLKQQADIIVHFDADSQHQANEIPQLIAPIVNQQTTVVLGSRFLKKDNYIPFFKKWFILKPAIFLQNFIYSTKLTDAHNGFRAFAGAALEKISLKQDGMAHSSEIIEQLVLNELPYLEVPVTIRYNEFGQGFLKGLKVIGDLILGKLNK